MALRSSRIALLIALGTVADVAQLRSLNRAFVTQGLKVMAARRNIGLARLHTAASHPELDAMLGRIQ